MERIIRVHVSSVQYTHSWQSHYVYTVCQSRPYECVKSIQAKLKSTMHVQFFDIYVATRLYVCIYTSTFGHRACNESILHAVYIGVHSS